MRQVRAIVVDSSAYTSSSSLGSSSTGCSSWASGASIASATSVTIQSCTPAVTTSTATTPASSSSSSSSSPSPSGSDSSGSGGSGPPIGAIIGGVAGTVAVGVAVVAMYAVRRRGRAGAAAGTTGAEPGEPNPLLRLYAGAAAAAAAAQAATPGSPGAPASPSAAGEEGGGAAPPPTTTTPGATPTLTPTEALRTDRRDQGAHQEEEEEEDEDGEVDPLDDGWARPSNITIGLPANNRPNSAWRRSQSARASQSGAGSSSSPAAADAAGDASASASAPSPGNFSPAMAASLRRQQRPSRLQLSTTPAAAPPGDASPGAAEEEPALLLAASPPQHALVSEQGAGRRRGSAAAAAGDRAAVSTPGWRVVSVEGAGGHRQSDADGEWVMLEEDLNARASGRASALSPAAPRHSLTSPGLALMLGQRPGSPRPSASLWSHSASGADPAGAGAPTQQAHASPGGRPGSGLADRMLMLRPPLEGSPRGRATSAGSRALSCPGDGSNGAAAQAHDERSTSAAGSPSKEGGSGGASPQQQGGGTPGSPGWLPPRAARPLGRAGSGQVRPLSPLRASNRNAVAPQPAWQAEQRRQPDPHAHDAVVELSREPAWGAGADGWTQGGAAHAPPPHQPPAAGPLSNGGGRNSSGSGGSSRSSSAGRHRSSTPLVLSLGPLSGESARQSSPGNLQLSTATATASPPPSDSVAGLTLATLALPKGSLSPQSGRAQLSSSSTEEDAAVAVAAAAAVEAQRAAGGDASSPTKSTPVVRVAPALDAAAAVPQRAGAIAGEGEEEEEHKPAMQGVVQWLLSPLMRRAGDAPPSVRPTSAPNERKDGARPHQQAGGGGGGGGARRSQQRRATQSDAAAAATCSPSLTPAGSVAQPCQPPRRSGFGRSGNLARSGRLSGALSLGPQQGLVSHDSVASSHATVGAMHGAIILARRLIDNVVDSEAADESEEVAPGAGYGARAAMVAAMLMHRNGLVGDDDGDGPSDPSSSAAAAALEELMAMQAAHAGEAGEGEEGGATSWARARITLDMLGGSTKAARRRQQQEEAYGGGLSPLPRPESSTVMATVREDSEGDGEEEEEDDGIVDIDEEDEQDFIRQVQAAAADIAAGRFRPTSASEASAGGNSRAASRPSSAYVWKQMVGSFNAHTFASRDSAGALRSRRASHISPSLSLAADRSTAGRPSATHHLAAAAAAVAAIHAAQADSGATPRAVEGLTAQQPLVVASGGAGALRSAFNDGGARNRVTLPDRATLKAQKDLAYDKAA